MACSIYFSESYLTYEKYETRLMGNTVGKMEHRK